MLLLLLWRVLLPLLPLLLLSGVSYGAEMHIKSADDLITLSNGVNSGATYSGTTVFLDNDLDFTGKEAMEPIGKDGSHNFLGTFDGQGHVIRSLKMNVTSSEYAGLFGYSEGLTVKDLVIDSSCSITSSLTGTNSFTGGIIGFLKTDKSFSTIESIVNMASVTFAGEITSDLHLGGVVGVAQSTNYDISIRNCVNYGTVVHDGVVNGYCGIGGIVAHFIGGTKYLQNCINYGAIRYTGSTVLSKYAGGIAGNVQCDESKETFIENCLSVGMVELNDETNGFIGGIAGNIVSAGINITHCFWTNDIGIKAAYGFNISIVTVSDSSLTELNTTTLNELNEYAERNGWSRMTAFHLNGGSINNLTQETLIVTEYHFPDPVKGDKTFLCWCEDIYCNVKYNTTNPSGASDVYAIWDMSTLTFNYGNRTSSTRATLFNETIVYPEDMRREGYTFVGWDPRPERMPGADLTIVALWAEAPVISSSSIEHSSSSIFNVSVEIVFGRKDLSREEIEKIIKPFTDEDFFIERIEVDCKTGETTVIVRFKEKEEARRFVETFRRSSEFSKYIKRIGVIDGLSSFSLLHNPMLLPTILIW